MAVSIEQRRTVMIECESNKTNIFEATEYSRSCIIWTFIAQKMKLLLCMLLFENEHVVQTKLGHM